jgi:alpha-L-fucosidase
MIAQANLVPFGALPTQNQMDWHRMQFYAFVHFGPNTFSGEEWGSGREDPRIFKPAKLDCRQWVKTFKDAGMTGAIITAKHHDGFCLWPSKFSEHTVAKSPWKNGKGDVLAELAEACKAEGLKMGVYLSPWDRNHPAYGTPEYNLVFANMLEEVLTNYGEVFEVWFDGANGEGPSGKKQVYDRDLFISTVRKHQPKAVVFGDAVDIRWVGNERGFGAETNWATLNRARYVPGTPLHAELAEGNQGGTDYCPAEADVSIRPGWFWRESENDKVKKPEELLDIYLASVGRGCNLLLNVPPNKDGLISQQDIDALTKLRSLTTLFLTLDAARDAEVIASPTHEGLTAANLNDGRYDTTWSPKNGARTASVLLRFEFAREISAVEIQEYMPTGQRVRKFEIEAEVKGKWVRIGEGTTIGYRRILEVYPAYTKKIRVTISDSLASPVLSSISTYSSQSLL